MRLVTVLTLFGAAANLFYTVYILMIAIFKSDIADGWLSLSLQQSGMFFLISIFFFILSEYILEMKGLKKNEHSNYISQEFGSTVISRHNKINLKENDSPPSDNLNNKTIET